ncbi:expressed unknown protein [Seminavis robusta]|uniref:Uncharacterized protein n=1 Tax=Seminavis robusta TaxID=568900 RepID=A0A9N8DIK5_9STRA|nr:expressed unknown protein [Seminavis robusta]|eukprot:Sro82_g043840.1 n/a (104) ;mRNA; f:55514-55825
MKSWDSEINVIQLNEGLRGKGKPSDGGRKQEFGGCKQEFGGCKQEFGGRKLEFGGRKLEFGGRKLRGLGGRKLTFLQFDFKSCNIKFDEPITAKKNFKKLSQK